MSELVHREVPSPNWNERQLPVSMLVLHYTGMRTADEAMARLCDPQAEVSAHYLIDEDGTVTRLVPEDRRAWHAGRSYWRGITDVNSASIGIELVNPGHEFGYRPFADAQMSMAALENQMEQANSEFGEGDENDEMSSEGDQQEAVKKKVPR